MFNRAKALTWAILIAFGFFILYPFWIGIVGSIKSVEEFSTIPVFKPTLTPTFQPFIEAWNAVKMPMFNSAIVALTTMVICVIFGVIGGYLLAHVKFKGFTWILALCVFGIYIPGVTKLVPLLETVQLLNLYDTPWGVGLAIGSMQLPLASVLYYQFFKQIPEVQFEVAEINGANHFNILRYLVIPLAKIPTVTVAILSFAAGWNNLLFPSVITSGNASTRPVTIMVSNLLWEAQRYSTFNKLLAGSIITALPIVLLYLIFQRYITSGFRQLGQGGD